MFWVVSGVWSYGAVFGFFQRAFPSLAEEERAYDRMVALLVAIIPVAGFVGTLTFLMLNPRGYQGLKFKD
jgi:hypothetical protein